MFQGYNEWVIDWSHGPWPMAWGMEILIWSRCPQIPGGVNNFYICSQLICFWAFNLGLGPKIMFVLCKMTSFSGVGCDFTHVTPQTRSRKWGHVFFSGRHWQMSTWTSDLSQYFHSNQEHMYDMLYYCCATHQLRTFRHPFVTKFAAIRLEIRSSHVKRRHSSNQKPYHFACPEKLNRLT